MLAERTLDNTRQLKRDNRQRRNGMEDLYGVCFSAHATELKDGRYTARFYISLSPDYVYLHRFAFKFVIMPSITEGEDPSEGRDWRVSIGTKNGRQVSHAWNLVRIEGQWTWIDCTWDDDEEGEEEKEEPAAKIEPAPAPAPAPEPEEESVEEPTE